MVGLLAGLDSVLGVPLAEAVARMPLDDAPRAVLLERAGPLGRVLDVVEAYESADTARLADSVSTCTTSRTRTCRPSPGPCRRTAT